MYTGPKTINNGLVYGYDTGYGIADNGNSTRFYPGEPTVNLMTAHFESLGTDGSGQSSVGTRTTIGTNHVKIVDNGSNTRQNVYISGLTASTTYTLSNQFKKISGTPTWRYQIQAYNNNSYVSTIKFTNTAEIGITDIDGWQTAKWTFTLPANSNRLLIFFQDGADYTTYDHSFEVKNPQLEAKGHSTVYVDGTRSDTAGLIDLKRTVNINVSNMSFDSSSQPTFDGTDDILNTGLFSGRNPSTDVFTIEAIVKSDTTSGNHMWLDATGNGTNQRLYCAHASTGTSTPLGIQNSGWSHSIPQDTDYHHYVITMNGSTAQLYNNNVAHSSKSYTSYTLVGQINVGGRSGYRWLGKIPVFKIYDKVLSTEEISKNYNAYKNRFNI